MSLQEMNLQDSLPHQEIRILRPKTMNNKSSRVTRDNVGASKAKITMNIENPNLRTKKTKSNLEKIEVEEEGPKQTLTLQESMARSRQIYLNRMKKKNQWKPNEAEMKVVKSHFKMNKSPSKEEKLKILSILEETCQSKVELAQISRWFQVQREKKAKRNSDDSKNTYKKFSQEELLFLREQFSLNTYPKTEEMKEISQRLNVSLSKIENWYKHNRRSLAKKGFFVLKTKKYFKKEEINYLVTMFETYPRPSKEQVMEMARSLNCTESQIKNWYSNKRKKQKLVLKKQGSDKPETHFEEELAVKSCGSSKQSQECLSSPCSDIPTALNSSQSFSSFIQRKESMDADMKPNLKINKGFKHFFSHSSQEECLKEVQPLIIPKPQVSNIPLLKVRSNTFENLNFKVDEPQPLKDSSFKLNAIPKLSLDTSEPIKASLSRSSSEILPSFKLNASAKINADNISKLISPTNLSQLQNSLMSLSNKGSSAAASTQSSNLQNLLNNQNFLGRPQKLGSSYENLCHLKYLANLYYLNNGPLFNGFVNPMLMSNPDHLLQNIQNIPALQTRLDENTSKKTPVFNHSFLSRMKTTEKTAFNPRILDLDIEAKKF